MAKKILFIFKNKENLKRTAIFVLTFAFLFFVLATSLVTARYNLTVGDTAKSDIKAQREVEDVTLTEERRQQAMDAVPLQYKKKTEVKTEAVDNINEFFSELKQTDKTGKTQTQFSLTDSQAKYMASLKEDQVAALQKLLVATIEELYDKNNISDDSQSNYKADIKNAQEFIKTKVDSSNLPEASKEIAAEMGRYEIRPNFYYDEVKTDKLKYEAAKAVEPVMIGKGQIIVKAGDKITEYQLSLLEDLGLLKSNVFYSAYLYASLGVLILLVMSLQWLYLFSCYPGIFNDNKKMMLINLLNCAAILLARTVDIASPFLIPLAFIPMLFTIVVNNRVSLASSALNCILISGAVNFDIEITILAVMNALIGSMVTRKLQHRSEILYGAVFVGAANAIMALSVGLLLSSNIGDIIRKTIFVLIAGILSGVLTIGSLPIIEHLFDVITNTKLLELSNPNSPLLKKLLMEAPGTYHHSVLVGNLAEVATEAVGGNPVFARVCAFYHDVGKIKRPYYFVENQLENDNPHDKISPDVSTQLIIAHVRDGVELAKEYKLPRGIIDVIEQHHGTSLVQYFYVTVKNKSENPSDIEDKDFRYKGPVPETKEAAIILLADSVEAAVRSITEPTREKFEEKVNFIIKSKINDRQLDRCDLTFKDIEKIRMAFIKVLNGIYHSRIEYPE